MTHPTRAAIYCRVSTSKQEEEGTSLETQRDACRAFATERGWAIVEDQVHREVYSGAELWDRPQLTLLRQAIRQKAVDVVVCYAIDRLSRDPVHLGVILSEAEHAGVPVEFVTEPLDDSPEGQLIRFVKGYAARVEREKARERTLRGKHARIASGKIHNYGHELYGYRRDKERGVRLIHEPEAAVVRRIFRWVAEGVPIRCVMRRLNTEGVPAPSAGKVRFRDGREPRWGSGAVHRILREPAYTGAAVAWRYRRTNTAGGYEKRPRDEWVTMPEGTTPAIVSADSWQAVQARLASNAAAHATRNATRQYLLRGLIACATCGRPMRSEPQGQSGRIYRCSSREQPTGHCGGKSVPATKVEAWVWSEIEAILGDESIIAAEVERQRKAGLDAALLADREAAARLADKLDRQQERLVRRLADAEGDEFPWELLEREIARTEQERRSARDALAELDARIGAQEAAIVRLDDLRAYCGRVRDNLGSLDFEHRRAAVEALIERVDANGADRDSWRLVGSLPLNAGIVSRSSKRCARHWPRSPARA
jgi:site-specific DNA recombinase